MSQKQKPPLPGGSEWTFESLEMFDTAIARVARERYKLDIYPVQLEVISSEQMMDAYASVGMPVGYHHWSYGKSFLATEKRYKRGEMGLAYEIVINSNPCIAYLMEENTLPMQALVIAHAAYGHNSFFKGNHLFRQWTDAGAIIDYLVFARDYIARCEERYGLDRVESLLDSCHALSDLGVDRYRHPPKLSVAEERKRHVRLNEWADSEEGDLYDRTIRGNKEYRDRIRHLHDPDGQDGQEEQFPAEPQENVLYFVEKYSPILEPWEREIVRIVRKIAQYFYPQRQTKVMNEGWATFWHYTILNTLYDEGLVSDGFMIEFLKSHTNVVMQPPVGHQWFTGINPYALGFAMFRDIRRICEDPTQEDREWFPEIAGSDWLATLDFAMRHFKDESFIQQYLSPRLMREMRLFSVRDDAKESHLRVTAIHADGGYRHVRETLANQYNLSLALPDIQVARFFRRGDRSLVLHHFRSNERPLGETTHEMMTHLMRLWGFPVHLDSVSEDEQYKTRIWSVYPGEDPYQP